MNIWTKILIVLAKCISLISQTFHFGAGATWPGEIALRFDPHILGKFSQQQKKIILVAGTNGKTTTVKMIETILTFAGYLVRRNATGANLDNGLVSAFIKDAQWDGGLRSDYFIFEVDEATLPNILKQLTPDILVLTNLFRDQLDRYGEVDTIAEIWQKALTSLPSSVTIIANADDPHLVLVGAKLNASVKYFGLEDASLYLPKMQHATDTIYCPRCSTRLTFGGVYFSHLGKWTCSNCKLTHPQVTVTTNDFPSPIEGVYNRYNTLAASLVARIVGIADEKIKQALKNFTPAFGRMEEIDVDGKRVKILLSKNPTGFNESIRTVLSSKQKGSLLLALNDRIPDGTDVSWIWDVDFENLAEPHGTARGTTRIVVSGDRCFDLGLRLKYALQTQNSRFKIQDSKFVIEQSLEKAITLSLEKTQQDEILWILPTYSAMLEVRKIITGKKIL